MAGILNVTAQTSAFANSLQSLQRDIDDAREVMAEIAKATPRLEKHNADIRAQLSAEARRLGPADISARMLRAASLNMDAMRSHLRTTTNRIERREAEIRLLNRQLERHSTIAQESTEDPSIGTSDTPEQEMRGELKVVTRSLIENLRQLAKAEAEHLALAEERLALLQSRVQLRAIRDRGGFEQDPQVAALRAIISRQTRDGTRLANESATIEPDSDETRLQKRLLSLQADDAIAHATQRLVDLDLLRERNEIEFIDELAGNRAVPAQILREGRSELDLLQDRLTKQRRELALERIALQERREMVAGPNGENSEIRESQLALVASLEDLLDFQEADIDALALASERSTELLDTEIGGRELDALTQRGPLPLDPNHRSLLKSELTILPEAIFSQTQGLTETLKSRLLSSSDADRARIAGAIVLLLAVLWIGRSVLKNLVSVDPANLPSVPIEALRRTLPKLLPTFVWLVLALMTDLDRRSTWLIAGALAMWPIVGMLLQVHNILATKSLSDRAGTQWGRMALMAAGFVGASVLIIYTAPMLPSMVELVDRGAFLGVALAAWGTWTLRRNLLDALQDWPQISAGWLRFLEIVTIAIPALLALASVGGLSGWVDLGWAITYGVGAISAAIGLVVGAACVLQNMTYPLRSRLRADSDIAALDGVLRLMVIVLAVGVAWILVRTYVGGATIMSGFWVLAFAIVLPFVLRPVQALVELLMKTGSEQHGGSFSVLAICVDRGVRALLIFGAALGLASFLNFDFSTVAAGNTLQAQVIRSGFNIALIALLGDFIWQLAKTLIDRRLALEGGGEESEQAEVGGEGGGPGASRLQTLLPLFRKFLMITVAVIVTMLILSSLGVNIGPLLAGAGVVGIAIGFGAQTLVRDIVSGVFFLMDDAFRIGEYVDVGEVKGTVEHISVRSMRLRHHRGALHTIPFGEITHLSNYSRDWAIMKLEFRVPYDTDMQKVKKIFKKIGTEMMANETIGPNLLDPPKSQGVFQMDDSAMIVRAKFMAKPGEQFVIRRELFHAIQREFEASGIEFARRQVSVFVPPDADTEKAAAAAQAAAIEEENANSKSMQSAR